ncbi:MAG: sortase [Candidatus Saccharimonadales bacterium]
MADSNQPNSNDLAAEVIRQKINSLYVGGAQESHEPNAAQERAEVQNLSHLSKHQQYMNELNASGKSLADIQVAWHNYYLGLPDQEKHQVWQEFYSERAKAKNTVAVPAPKPKAKTASRQTIDTVKKQLLGSINSRGKLKAKHHLQSILFGLGIGSFSVIILLFGLFNERVVAPFITPSKVVTNTPIISDNTTVANNQTEVIIPKINVEIPVIYDQTSTDEHDIQTALESGVVHYATTASPGEQGNTVIFGHSSNNILNKGKYKFAFVLLNRLEIGDTFSLTKGGKRYVYRIYEKKIVKPSEVSVLEPTEKTATATLITCDPPGTSINRLVVIGEQISPDPITNGASTAIKSAAPAIVPSNAPSLWQRITDIFS